MTLNERWSIFEVLYKKDKKVHSLFITGTTLAEAIERAKEWCLLKSYYHVHTTEWLFDIDADIERLKEVSIERKLNGIVPGVMIKEKIGA